MCVRDSAGSWRTGHGGGVTWFANWSFVTELTGAVYDAGIVDGADGPVSVYRAFNSGGADQVAAAGLALETVYGSLRPSFSDRMRRIAAGDCGSMPTGRGASFRNRARDEVESPAEADAIGPQPTSRGCTLVTLSFVVSTGATVF